MDPEKNLHASIPNALLAKAQEVAETEHMTVDELVRDAMERRIGELRRRRLYAYGEAQASKVGVGEEDVEDIVHRHRQDARPAGS